MADVNAVDLTQETLATLDGTEQIIMFDTAEGKRATVSAVGDYILKKLTTLDSQTAQTVINNLKSRVTTLEGHNAFAEFMIGNSQIKADSAEDYLTLEAGAGITLTPDVANDKVTIGTSLTKSNVGLGNVDNTADAVKEVAYADDAGTVNEHTVESDVPANAVFTDTTYNDATTSVSGLMSASDKTAVNKIGNTAMGTTATTITGAIAEHEGDISALSAKLSYDVVVPNTTFKGTKANAWECTNISFTVPSGYIYVVGVTQTWASGKPIGIGLGTSTSLSVPNIALQAEPVTRQTFLLAAGTYYIYTMRETAPTANNTYNVYAIKIKI